MISESMSISFASVEFHSLIALYEED